MSNRPTTMIIGVNKSDAPFTTHPNTVLWCQLFEFDIQVLRSNSEYPRHEALAQTYTDRQFTFITIGQNSAYIPLNHGSSTALRRAFHHAKTKRELLLCLYLCTGVWMHKLPNPNKRLKFKTEDTPDAHEGYFVDNYFYETTSPNHHIPARNIITWSYINSK